MFVSKDNLNQRAADGPPRVGQPQVQPQPAVGGAVHGAGPQQGINNESCANSWSVIVEDNADLQLKQWLHDI